MTDRKRKLIRRALWIVVILALVYGNMVYRRFHDRQAWIDRSSANPRWAVDCIGTGFLDRGFDFRVHDLRASLLRPIRVCDLYWEQLYMPNQLHWSKDGTVAAITVSFSGHGVLYGCAYDFREHRSYRTGSFASPLEPSEEFSRSIAELLASRGGKTKPIEVPDPTKMYIEDVK